MRTVAVPRVSRRTALLTTFLMVVALVTAITTAGADGGPLFQHFELDEDLLDDPAGTPDDWEALFGGTSTDATLTATTDIPIQDNDSIDTLGLGTMDTSYFHGGGSKDVNDVSSWGYSSNDVAGDKMEILNAAAAGYVADLGGGEEDTIIYFAADRYSNDGDAAIGFWFFKNEISLNGNGGFTGVHSVGDVLVVSDFSGGGATSTINVWQWVGGSNKQSSLQLVHSTDVPGTEPADCTNAGHNEDVCATANEGDEEGVWAYQAKSTAITPNTPAGGYPQGTFLEGGINITQLLPDSDGCFASFLAETRSSTSETAQLKDFALGDLPLCAPSTDLDVSVTGPSVIHTGESTTLQWSETNDGSGPADFIALSDAEVVTDDASCNETMALISGDDGDGLLDGGETWVFECTVTVGTASGTVTVTGVGHGSFRGTDITWCEDPANPPANTICDQDEIAEASFVVIEPSTELALNQVEPTNATVHSGEPVTITFWETNDGDSDLTDVQVTADNDCTLARAADDVAGDGDNILEPGETWAYSCTVNPTSTTTYTAQAQATDEAGATVGYCDGVEPEPDLCDQDESDDVIITVVNPSTDLDLGSPLSDLDRTIHGPDPSENNSDESVTLTFTETNDGDDPLTNVSLQADNGCSLTRSADNPGDDDDVLEPTETWVYSCTVSPSTTTTYTVTASGTDSTGDQVTWCADPNDPPTSVFCDQDERVQTTVTVINPSTTLTKTASATITYTYVETNDGNVPLTNPTVTDDQCTNVDDVDEITEGVNDGDVNADGVLDPGESWLYTCTTTLNGDGSITNTATGSGTDPLGDDVTWCADTASRPAGTYCDQDEQDSVTVTIQEH